jgi:hypothetical protein
MKKGRRIDDQQLNSRLSRAQPQIQRMLADANTRARALLTPAQLRMLPATPSMGGLLPGGRPGAAPGGAAGASPSTIKQDVIMGPGTVIIKGGGGEN